MIPKVYFDALQMQDEVTVESVDGGGGLVEKELRGQELVEKFKEVKSNMGWTSFHPDKEGSPYLQKKLEKWT